MGGVQRRSVEDIFGGDRWGSLEEVFGRGLWRKSFEDIFGGDLWRFEIHLKRYDYYLPMTLAAIPVGQTSRTRGFPFLSPALLKIRSAHCEHNLIVWLFPTPM